MINKFLNFWLSVPPVTYMILIGPQSNLNNKKKMRGVAAATLKNKYIFVLQNSKFRQISKLPDDIHRTYFFSYTCFCLFIFKVMRKILGINIKIFF